VAGGEARWGQRVWAGGREQLGGEVSDWGQFRCRFFCFSRCRASRMRLVRGAVRHGGGGVSGSVYLASFKLWSGSNQSLASAGAGGRIGSADGAGCRGGRRGAGRGGVCDGPGGGCDCRERGGSVKTL